MADYSINAVTRRVVYTGSAGVGPYAFSFEILTATDIAVYKNSTKLTLTTNYTVTINANGTGSVTLASAATGSDTITIIGSRAIERTTDFVTAGDLLAASLNEQLDSQIVMIQQLAEENKRTLKAPQYDPASVDDGGTLNMVLPVASSRASKTLAFDASGNPIAGPTATEVSNAQTYATNAATSASASAASASTSSTKAAEATASAAAAASSASSASSSASSASSSSSSASSSAATATTQASDAAASAILANDWATKTSGPVAGGEYSAKYHANAASTSASNASTSASNAATSASNANTAKVAAQSAQSAAEAARDSALAAYDNFDDRYLGPKASDPTLDNDGNALLAGALYFNTTVPEMRLYTGSAWVAAYVTGGSPTFSGVIVSANSATDAVRITQTGAGNAFVVEDSANPDSSPFIIDASGNVGIGTSSPAASLSVVKQTTALSGTGNSYGLYMYPTSSGLAYIDAITGSTGNSSLGLRTYNNGTYNEVRIDSSGRVGINNNSPLSMLHVVGTSAIPALETNNILETSTISATAATGTINYDAATQSVLYYTSNASANWTLNIRASSGTSLNTFMATGDTLTIVHMVTQGATAYYNSAVQVDGSSVTPKWQGGTAPTAGNASSVDIYTYTVIKTGSAAFTVLASQTQFK